MEELDEDLKDTEHIAGIGNPLIDALDVKVPGLKNFSAYSNSILNIAITQSALFVALRGDDTDQLDTLANTLNKTVANVSAAA